jgi:recombinational DNA repair protein (RecF pathway)
MAHHIYHTRGIVLGSVATGEANMFYQFLTEELGLVGAMAQGVRHGKGKLKMMLQDFSRVKIDLVRGREVWRVVSVLEDGSSQGFRVQRENMVLFARLASLVRRLVHGEDRNDELFRGICGAHDFLETETIQRELVSAFEALAALRILAWLGYVDTSAYGEFCGYEREVWNTDILARFRRVSSRAVSDINTALKASHL